ncbi:MAG TPA: hypothetical protein VFS24_17350 [Steroidobacteraceae bacterium]|nr:hypothetical protein [Steroidobacteraceae bacterium]
MKVQTIDGLIDRDQLEARDIITEEDNARVVATEWYLGTKMVRRDVHVSILCGQSVFGEQANLG